VIKPAYSVSFLLSINISVWQNILYFLNDLRILNLLFHFINYSWFCSVTSSLAQPRKETTHSGGHSVTPWCEATYKQEMQNVVTLWFEVLHDCPTAAILPLF
jgi:hypothetical protein